jgi:hypothetical protein
MLEDVIQHPPTSFYPKDMGFFFFALSHPIGCEIMLIILQQ